MEFPELFSMLLIAWSLRARLKISWIWRFNFFRMLTIYSIFCVDADFDGQICYCECWLSATFFCVMLTSILKKCPKWGECWLRPPPHLYPHTLKVILKIILFNSYQAITFLWCYKITFNLSSLSCHRCNR